jgi:phage-related tail protein
MFGLRFPQLVEQLGADNVVAELGGTLAYNHEMWISNRTNYERIVHLHKKTMGRLPETKKGLGTFKMPSTVKDAERLMQEELGLKEKMINLFAESELKMDQFLTSLNDQQSHAPASLDLRAMTSSVGEMLIEVKDSQKEFDDFWKIHRTHSEHIMRMCHFSRSGEKLKQMMGGHISDLAEDKAVLGDSLESALEQGEKHEHFATKCLETIDEQMTKIKQDAGELCDPNHLPNESEAEMHAAMQKAQAAVQTQLQELTKTYQTLSDICQQKRDLYIVCVKFHMNLRQLQQWNDETMLLLASQPLEEPTPSAALNLLSSIEQCQMGMTSTHITNLTELASTLGSKTFKKKNDAVIKKYEHARNLLEHRKTFLQRILSSHFPRPVAPPSPNPLHRSKPAPDSSFNEIDVHLEVTPDRRSLTSTVSTASSEGLVAGDYQDMETDGGVLKNRQFVYKELVATEQDYIKDISTVIDSYYDEMDPESLIIPLRLRGKREIVFGNLLEIKTFHETDFSKALEKYADCPERVGECFTQHVSSHMTFMCDHMTL